MFMTMRATGQGSGEYAEYCGMGRGRTQIRVLKRMLCRDCRSPYVRIWVTFDPITREANEAHFNHMVHDNSCPSAIPGQRCVDHRLPRLTMLAQESVA